MEKHYHLLQAASFGDVQQVNHLRALLCKEELYGECQTLYKALQYAGRNGHQSTIKVLLDDVSPELWCFIEKDKETQYDEKGGWYFYGAEMMASPLHLAVKEGHLRVVKQILHFFHDKQVLIPDLKHEYADKIRQNLEMWFKCLVEWAVRWGHGDIVQLLLTPPFPLPPNWREATLYMDLPVHLAAQHNHLDVLKRLLEAAARCPGNLNAELFSHKDGLTALHLVAQSGFTYIVEFLLNSEKVDANARSHPEFFTPLHMAASSGRAEVVSLLLQSLKPNHNEILAQTWNVDILFAKDRMGRTALHYAAREGHQHVLKLLLDSTESGNIAGIPDLDGLLALHMAAQGGHVEVIRTLICHHADSINILARHRLEMRSYFAEEFISKFDKDGNGYSSATAHIAKFHRPKQVDSLFWKTEGFTPLHFAARYGQKAAVKELINGENREILANVLLKDHAGFLAFDWMKIQKKGKFFLRCVVDSRGSAVVEALLQEASCIRKMTKKMRSNIVEDIDEEKKAMEELQWAEIWESERSTLRPPLTICVLKWLMQESAYSKLWNEYVFARKNGIKSAASYSKWNEYVLTRKEGKASRDVAAVIGSALQLAFRKASKSVAQEILLLLDNEQLEYFVMLVLQWFVMEPNDILIQSLYLLPAKVAFDHHKDVKVVTSSLTKALCEHMFPVAKKILLLLHPDVVLLNHYLLQVVKEQIAWDKISPAEIEFLEVLVRYDKVAGTSSLLRWMLARAQRDKLTHRLVDAILDKPEVKRGLYEDRQVYLDSANAILVGAALIGGVAFSAWLQPPLGYSYEYEGGDYVHVHKGAVRMFWRFNNAAFFLSVASLIAGAKGAVPVARESHITKAVEKVKRAVAVASTLLALALVCVVGGFIEAGIAALPPISSDLEIMHTYAIWGGLMCSLALFWFSLSIMPLLLDTVLYIRERVPIIQAYIIFYISVPLHYFGLMRDSTFKKLENRLTSIP
ncbi:hypothetical protein L7F22_013005 [Adiantum nelumboides]|nr:hypothetical protein [Adiantum nelumboides]